MAMKVPWDYLAVVRGHGVCILQNHVHCSVELQSVDQVARGGIDFVHDTVVVGICIAGKMVGWWALIEHMVEILVEGIWVRCAGEVERHIIHGPMEITVNLVPCDE